MSHSVKSTPIVQKYSWDFDDQFTIELNSKLYKFFLASIKYKKNSVFFNQKKGPPWKPFDPTAVYGLTRLNHWNSVDHFADFL